MTNRTKRLFADCYGEYAIPAFNVFNMEQVLALFHAAQKSMSPVIIQTTPAARDYATPVMLLGMIQSAARVYPEVVYAIHLDHGVEEHIVEAIGKGGYDSVMIDASHDSLDKNIARTKAVVEKAHDKGIAVEAELGVLSGVEDESAVGDQDAMYTRPEDVERFVTETGCDSLAIAVGTSHGAYKFSGGQGLQFNILKRIQEKLPGFPLVLHGASSVDENEIARINNAGGKLKESARGVSHEELRKAIKLGVCKVNIATDARILWARVYREFFRDSPDQFDPVIPGKSYVQCLEACYIEKFEMLGAAGKAKPI